MDHPIEVDVNGQTYRYLGVEEYPNAKNGYLHLWSAACPVCGLPFVVKISGAFRHNHVRRRCDEHRAPGIMVGKLP